MNYVWVGWIYRIGEQGYDRDFTSDPIIVFDNITAAQKWRNNERDRKIKKLHIEKNACCRTCKSTL